MARSNTLSLQPVVKGVAGSSSSHAADTVGGTEGGKEGGGEDDSEHMARASSLLDEDFEDPPVEGVDYLEEDAGPSRRLSIGQAVSGPSNGV